MSLEKCFWGDFCTGMDLISGERGVWLALNVLPHEAALRAWLCRRKVFDLEIDDIVQEAYAKLAALPSVELIREPRLYLFQTANSIILGHLRRSRIVSIAAAADLDHFGLAAPDPTPEQQVEYRDELREFILALGSLPKSYREAFILRRITCLSQKETAERLGISQKTVEKYMAKSIRLLMDILGRGDKSAAQAPKAAAETTLSGKRARSGHGEKIVEPGG
jgi:RNA polymerase sigma-70 factor (ECF subfamily)